LVDYINSNNSISVNASIKSLQLNCQTLSQNIPAPYYNQIKNQDWNKLSNYLLTSLQKQIGSFVLLNIPLPDQAKTLLSQLKISDINLFSKDDFITLEFNIGEN